MSSSVKRAQATVKTASTGRRYVEMSDVIQSELDRIENCKQSNIDVKPTPSRNGGAPQNGTKEDKKK